MAPHLCICTECPNNAGVQCGGALLGSRARWLQECLRLTDALPGEGVADVEKDESEPHVHGVSYGHHQMSKTLCHSKIGSGSGS